MYRDYTATRLIAPKPGQVACKLANAIVDWDPFHT